MLQVSELVGIGIGIAVFFVIFGAMIGTVMSGLNLTYYSTAGGSGTPNLTTTDLSNMRQMRGWYFLGGFLLTIAAFAVVVIQSFK